MNSEEIRKEILGMSDVELIKWIGLEAADKISRASKVYEISERHSGYFDEAEICGAINIAHAIVTQGPYNGRDEDWYVEKLLSLIRYGDCSIGYLSAINLGDLDYLMNGYERMRVLGPDEKIRKESDTLDACKVIQTILNMKYDEVVEFLGWETIRCIACWYMVKDLRVLYPEVSEDDMYEIVNKSFCVADAADFTRGAGAYWCAKVILQLIIDGNADMSILDIQDRELAHMLRLDEKMVES